MILDALSRPLPQFPQSRRTSRNTCTPFWRVSPNPLHTCLKLYPNRFPHFDLAAKATESLLMTAAGSGRPRPIPLSGAHAPLRAQVITHTCRPTHKTLARGFHMHFRPPAMLRTLACVP